MYNRFQLRKKPLNFFVFDQSKKPLTILKHKNMRRLILLMVIIAGTMLTTTAQPHGKRQMSNPNRNEMNCFIPNLTEDQQTQIETLRLEYMKQCNQYQAEIAEMQATKHKLMIADKPDQKSINALIDKISSKQAEMHKATVAHQIAVRNLLTDEQKVVFDNRPMNRKNYGKGRSNEFRGRMGMGMGPFCPMNQNQAK